MSEEANFSPPWTNTEYLITQGPPYLIYNDIELTYKIGIMECVFKYEPCGVIMKDCYSQEIIVDENPSEKDIFTLKLRGDTESVHPTRPKDN
jgi:hypothetical protein